MLFGRICCRDMKKTYVVEDGLKLGGEEGEDLVPPDIPFADDIDENIEGERTVSGREYGMI